MNTQIIENNKLLAEFMGWKEKEDRLNVGDEKSMFFATPFNREFWSEGTSISREGWEQTELFTSEDMVFHLDWNWLMQVVEKIDEVCGIDLHEWDEHINNALCSKSLSTTYNACVEFVQWYNNQNK
jgi:hypothetical protein